MRRGISVALVVSAVLLGVCGIATATTRPGSSTKRVLQVGTWEGRSGRFTSIQSAVNAAKPGDTILIAPGDYHESPRAADGVRITTPDLLIRGLSRRGVVVDGTRPGAPQSCDPDASWQNFGPHDAGRDGIVISGVDNVRIENLTVCNFVGGDRGREVAVDGGYGTGSLGVGAYEVANVTTTSTYVSSDPTQLANYGIFVSDVKGPGRVLNSFASNMANSGLHIGACADCDSTFDGDTAEHNVIGFTAINAGGRLVIEHSTIDDNAAGVDLSSEQDESAPPPQDGACPSGKRGPVPSHRRSCTAVLEQLRLEQQ